MNVLFVDPPGPAFGLNIGIGILAAVLEKEGHRVLVTDLNNRRTDGLAALGKDIADFRPDLVGVSVYATKYGSAQDVVRYIRGVCSAPIMAGGPQVSADMEVILEECPGIDFLVYGEAEGGIAEIVRCVGDGMKLEGIRGVIYRTGGGVVRNPPREIVRDVSQVPIPDFEAFGVRRISEYPVLTSRGCPYSCIFCFSHIGRGWRERTPGDVTGELKVAKEKFGISSFGVWDPVFNLKTSHVVDFCASLARENIGLPWNCYSVRADRVDEDQARAMKEAGCRQVYMGVETLDEEIMKRINKRETVSDIRRAVDIYRRHGLVVNGFFILGLPGDTFRRSLAACAAGIDLKFDDQVWSHLTPYPGTAVVGWVKEYGRFLADYRMASTGWNEVIFETPEYPRDDRERAMRLIQWKLSHWPVVVSPRYPQAIRALLVLAGILRYDAGNTFRHFGKLFQFLAGRIGAATTSNQENVVFE